MMTPVQKKKVKWIDRELKEIFPDFYGSIRFNLAPPNKKYNVNVVENIIE